MSAGGESSAGGLAHDVAMPPGVEADETMRNLNVGPHEPARAFPFELDPFQRAAVACIEREESVLVSAHTSAGKTVCAEYAIGVCLRDKQRVIYTSPIKALSNQKYRELFEAFGDVGLMTVAHRRHRTLPAHAASVCAHILLLAAGRLHDQHRRLVPRDDHRDPPIDALPRFGSDA